MPITGSHIRRLVSQNKGFILFVLLMLMFRSAIADWNDVPSGSMQPTIEIGDRIIINKLAYDLRMPLTQHRLMHFDDPQQGDIIIFESAAAGKRLVKRVIGVPGDVIVLKNNHLFVNGKLLQQKATDNQTSFQLITEELGETQYQVKLAEQSSALANVPKILVPNDHYFVLGDNRDNSADSRVIGFVPRGEIIGRSKKVAFSLDYDNYFLPRKDRFLKDL